MATAALILALFSLALSLVALFRSRLGLFLADDFSNRDQVVRFDESEIILAGEKPPLQNDQGNFEFPDLIISGGRPKGPVPRSLRCPSTYVIYSSALEFVGTCQGFGGPNDGNNRIVIKALQTARKVASGIACQGDCKPQVDDIWRGWSCNQIGNRFSAVAAVEVKISCLPSS